MKKILLIVVAFFVTSCVSQSNNTIISEIQNFQNTLNSEYKNPKETPLRGTNFTNFKQHPFFPINLKYRVSADLVKTENAIPFEIPTSSGKSKTYVEYGKAHFSIEGKKLSLTLYQMVAFKDKPGFEDYLFLPFRDLTNTIETYGGGKYMDLRIPKNNTLILDFNQSYHPLCAYNAYDYNCPLVPEENNLPVRIEAGVMYEDVYHH